jgi:tetratricopeptide (TPR) repeat protein
MQRCVGASIVLLIVCLFTGVVAAQSPATGSEAEARAAFERGRVLYDSGEFVQAAQAFEEAHRLSGRDALLYNLYLAHRDANQPEQAAVALRGFLTKVENIENRAQLEARLAALEQGLAREREEREREAAAAAASSQAAQEKPAEPRAATAEAEPGKSLRFISAVSLASVGGAMMVASIATGLMARSRQNELEDECPNKLCDSSLEDTAESGEKLARTTDVLLFGGLAVAAAGTVLLFLDLRANGETNSSARTRTPRLVAACSGRGCAATATLRF